MLHEGNEACAFPNVAPSGRGGDDVGGDVISDGDDDVPSCRLVGARRSRWATAIRTAVAMEMARGALFSFDGHQRSGGGRLRDDGQPFRATSDTDHTGMHMQAVVVLVWRGAGG